MIEPVHTSHCLIFTAIYKIKHWHFCLLMFSVGRGPAACECLAGGFCGCLLVKPKRPNKSKEKGTWEPRKMLFVGVSLCNFARSRTGLGLGGDHRRGGGAEELSQWAGGGGGGLQCGLVAYPGCSWLWCWLCTCKSAWRSLRGRVFVALGLPRQLCGRAGYASFRHSATPWRGLCATPWLNQASSRALCQAPSFSCPEAPCFDCFVQADQGLRPRIG